MHTLKITNGKGVEIEGEFSLDPKERYLVDDINVGQFMQIGIQQGATLEAEPWRHPKIAKLHTGNRMLVIRTGGFGDLVLLSPVLNWLCGQNPDLEIDVACFRRFRYAVTAMGMPRVRPVDYPPPLEPFRYATIGGLEMAVESRPRVHTTDAFAEVLGATIRDEDKAPLFVVDDGDRRRVREKWPKVGEIIRIGISPFASTPLRSYPGEAWVQFMRTWAGMSDKPVQFVIFGGAEQSRFEGEGILDLHGLTTWGETAALLETCDGFVGVDSACLHVAGALGTPSVGLYGPFDGSARTRYHLNAKVAYTTVPCSPCWYHGHGGRAFPEGMPCEKEGACPALYRITPGEICRKLNDARHQDHARKARD